jgi:hypothetical protein
MTKNALLNAVNEAAHKQTPVAPTPVPAKAAGTYVTPSREGKFQLNTWLPADFKTSLRALQVKFPSRSFQDLLEEALNDLFAKYDAPVVSAPVTPEVKPARARAAAKLKNG